MTKNISSAISSEYLRYRIDEDISIYEGRFCIYLDRKYRCSGIIYYKMTPPISINFKAQILFIEDEDVDLIIIAASGKSGLHKFFIGSVAERVLKTTERDVLLIHN